LRHSVPGLQALRLCAFARPGRAQEDDTHLSIPNWQPKRGATLQKEQAAGYWAVRSFRSQISRISQLAR
jgi:hypothetical protein